MSRSESRGSLPEKAHNNDQKGSNKKAKAGISTPGPVFAAHIRAVKQRKLELTPAEQWKLVQAYRESGDLAAKQDLIHSNLLRVIGIAGTVARKWPNLAVLDLIQEGHDGLIHACDKYNITKYAGVKNDPQGREYKTFGAYAEYWIRERMMGFVLANWGIVIGGQTPGDKRAFYRISKEQREAMARGEKPSLEDIARSLRVPLAKVQRAADHLKGDVSMDSPKYKTSDTPWMEFSRGNPLPSPHGRTERADIADRVRSWLADLSSSLDPKEQRILKDRLLVPDKPMSLQQLGDVFDVSRERIRQVEAKLLTKLRFSAKKKLGSAEDLLD